MKLDQEFIKKVKPAIINTWQQIGSDLEACCAEEGEALNNDEAIECCIDADRLKMYGGDGDVTINIIREAVKEHNYGKVLTFLVRNINLL